MTVRSLQAKSGCGSIVNVRLPWQMVPFPTALQVKKDGGGGVSDCVTCCAAKLAGTGMRTPSRAVSSAVNRTRCRMRIMSLLPFLRRSRSRPSERDLVVECGVWSFLRCFGGGLVPGEPDGFHEAFAGDAEPVAGLDDGRPGGALEQAQHQVVGGEQQRAEVGDAAASCAGPGPGALGDLLEAGLGDAGPVAFG